MGVSPAGLIPSYLELLQCKVAVMMMMLLMTRTSLMMLLLVKRTMMKICGGGDEDDIMLGSIFFTWNTWGERWRSTRKC